MPPSQVALDRQPISEPAWVLDSVGLPRRYYGTRTFAFPVSVDGTPFSAGSSPVGGTDPVGGGAGGVQDRPVQGRILNQPVIVRSLVHTSFGPVEVQEVTVELDNANGELRGDYRTIRCRLWGFDVSSKVVVDSFSGIIMDAVRDRTRFTLTLASLDVSTLTQRLPTDQLTRQDYPFGVDLGQTPNRLWGNADNVPLQMIRDYAQRAEFDYLVTLGRAVGIRGCRRIAPGATQATVAGEMSFDEFDPEPWSNNLVTNPSLDVWPTAALPQGWGIAGAGASISKNTTPGQFEEGTASASLTRLGANAQLRSTLTSAGFVLKPISWWQGRTITVTFRVRPGAPTSIRVRVNDGVTVTTGAYNVASAGAFETLTHTVTLSTVATFVQIGVLMDVDSTAQIDSLRFSVGPARNWEEVLNYTAYPGRTAVRTLLRQDDANLNLYQLRADINGLQEPRNLARAIRTILSDAALLNKPVNAASANQAEADAAFHYTDLAVVDRPELLADFDDAAEQSVARDTSGHERHGVYHMEQAFPSGIQPFHVSGFCSEFGPPGDGAIAIYANDPDADGSWVSFPWNAGFYPDAAGPGWTLELLFKPWADLDTGLMDLTHQYPILDLLIGAATASGIRLHQTSGTLQVNVVLTVSSVSTSVALTNADLDQWLHIAVRLSGFASGTLSLDVTRLDGSATRSATPAAYAVPVAVGVGELLIGKGGTGYPATPGKAWGVIDKVLITREVLTDARLAIKRAWLLAYVTSEPYNGPTCPLLDATRLPSGFHQPTHVYMLDDTDNTTLFDQGSAATDGVYEGDAVIVYPGYLPNRFYSSVNPNYGVRFANDPTSFCHVDSVSYDANLLYFSIWYKPDVLAQDSGILEFAIGGANDTAWSLQQTSAGLVTLRAHATGGVIEASVSVLQEDVGRYMHLLCGYDNGRLRVRKNLTTITDVSYVGSIATGTGTLYLGILGQVAGVETTPCIGALDDLFIYDAHGLTEADQVWLFTSGTMLYGGLLVDLLLKEQRDAQDWLRELLQLRWVRIAVIDGEWHLTVDRQSPTAFYDARDGEGAGPRTLQGAEALRFTPVDQAPSEVEVRYRLDLSTGQPLFAIRQVVRPFVGKLLQVTLTGVRDHATADRFTCMLAGRLLAGERSLSVILPMPDFRRVREGSLVRITDDALGLTQVMHEARKVELGTTTVKALLAGWDEELIYSYRPGPFPLAAGPG